MDGPVLSGGVVVVITALLWLVYLLPSWRRRHEYDSVERDAVRLNQALRVLAETSEVPDEVRVELNTKSAHAQHKLAKKIQAEKQAAELETLRAELAATRFDPAVRQARARRRMRLFATVLLLAGLAVAGVGVWQVLATGTQVWLWAGLATAFVSVIVLQRMASVAARAVRRQREAAAVSVRARVAPPLHDQGPATWTPRRVPEPMVSVAGSRAQAAHLSAEEQRARHEAAREEELRRRAERMAPPAPVTLPARAPAAAPVARPAAASGPDFSKMGYVDDAEIEAHVRQLLAGRATG